jgi:cell shape-determining protein MreC
LLREQTVTEGIANGVIPIYNSLNLPEGRMEDLPQPNQVQLTNQELLTLMDDIKEMKEQMKELREQNADLRRQLQLG